MSTSSKTELVYPDSDGLPMAENTLQFEWIVTIEGNLELLYKDDPAVFVAGDLLWYPVEGRPDIRVAPDVLIAYNRPKGYRGSYRQWVEDDVPMQVVFEILSPGNTPVEMQRKRVFYETYGVEEYYVYDPGYEPNPLSTLEIWQRDGEVLRQVPQDDAIDWVSPLMKIRCVFSPDGWKLFYPTGESFQTFRELGEAQQQAIQQRQAAEAARQQAEQQRQQAEQQRQQAEQQRDEEKQRRIALEERLRALGVDPDEM